MGLSIEGEAAYPLKARQDLGWLPPDRQEVRRALGLAQDYLLSLQDPKEGFWAGEVQSDTTLTSEYIMFMHFLNKVDSPKVKKGAQYLIDCQLPEGGWNIYPGGISEISASVKAYFALKLAGVSPQEQLMVKARQNILAQGGAAGVNVFTKIYLALFGQYPWRGIPSMPAELILLPRNAFFNSVSYWSRTVIIPLLIILASKPQRVVPRELGISELYNNIKGNGLFSNRNGNLISWGSLFIALDRLIKIIESGILERPGLNPLRKLSLAKAENWMVERLVSGGLGAIFPAMVNSIIAMKCLGFPDDHPLLLSALKEVELLEVSDERVLRMQPCHSPIWDTAIAINALAESGLPRDHPALLKAARWLLKKQVRRKGDWAAKRAGVEPGGWYFQFFNEFYPDNDDTAMVLTALRKVLFPAQLKPESEKEWTRGLKWLLNMQCHDGGWGSFDIDNNKLFLNTIPFADHGALLDPSTPDLTGRALEAIGLSGLNGDIPGVGAAIGYLKAAQEPIGAWYGRWGVNYIYGTWSALSGLKAVREDMAQPYIRKAVHWLKSKQNPDGGWGEDCITYINPTLAGAGKSTPSQTAWALLSLMNAGETKDKAVARGIRFLLDAQRPDGGWEEKEFTGTGFPRVFYLRYHLYPIYFPLWALAMYNNASTGDESC